MEAILDPNPQVETLDEAIAIENANPYGNAAAIYTTSGQTALETAPRQSYRDS